MLCICLRLLSRLPWMSLSGSFTMKVFTTCSQSRSCPMSFRKDSETTEFSVLSALTRRQEATSPGNWSRSANR